MSADKQNGSFQRRGIYKSDNFHSDYNTVSIFIKQHINANFPDNYHARLGTGKDNAYDHEADRAPAVDMVSRAIAAALRNGATVQQAADAIAASAGI